MKKDPKMFLQHILESIELIQEYTGIRTWKISLMISNCRIL